MDNLEIIVWYFLIFLTICGGITVFIAEKEHPSGKKYDTNVVLGLLAGPRIFFWHTITLILFSFIDINKLHLIWIFPIIYWAVTMKWAKHVDKQEGRNL